MKLGVAVFLFFCAASAEAEERIGIIDHNTAVLGDVVTSGREQGPNVEAEIASDTGVAPFAVLSLNTRSETSFAVVGIERRWGDSWFVRPAIGLAAHNGHLDGARDQVKLGSRALVYARLDLGYDFGRWNMAVRVEHLSNGNTATPNNGLDEIGLVMGRRN